MRARLATEIFYASVIEFAIPYSTCPSNKTNCCCCINSSKPMIRFFALCAAYITVVCYSSWHGLVPFGMQNIVWSYTTETNSAGTIRMCKSVRIRIVHIRDGYHFRLHLFEICLCGFACAESSSQCTRFPMRYPCCECPSTAGIYFCYHFTSGNSTIRPA